MTRDQTDQRRQERLTIRDPQVMRALAHPARLAIMEHLFGGRTATATECAEVVGLSPSATSYHLRALAKAGLLEEAPSRGDGRERVWQTPLTGLSIDSDQAGTADSDLAKEELLGALLAHDDAKLRTWLASAAAEPREWYEATSVYSTRLVLTAAELLALSHQIQDLFNQYGMSRRVDPPPGSRRVSAMFRAFPTDRAQ